MSANNWNWKLVGKAWSLISIIINRFKELSQKQGSELDFSFVAWLATEAPNKVYTDLLGHALNAWQNHQSAQNLAASLEWKEEFFGLEFWTLANGLINEEMKEAGWRLPTIRELQIENTANPNSFRERRSYYWSSEIEGEIVKYFCPEQNSAVNGNFFATRARVKLVRTATAEKTKIADELDWTTVPPHTTYSGAESLERDHSDSGWRLPKVEELLEAVENHRSWFSPGLTYWAKREVGETYVVSGADGRESQVPPTDFAAVVLVRPKPK